MVAVWLAVANPKPPVAPKGWWDPRILWVALAFAGIIVLGALVIAWLDRWRKRSATPSFDTTDQLAHFRELYEQGELSQAEFERIRVRLSAQLRKDLEIPGDQPPAAPPQLPQPPA